MSRIQRCAALAATMLAAVVTPAVSAAVDRVLLRNDDVVVRVEQPLRCAGEVDVVIESATPDLFARDSDRMQSIVDSAQAMLRYECPVMVRLRVTGFLSGLEQGVYSGVALQSARWEVTPERTLASQPVERGAIAAHGIEGRFSVALNRLGMSEEEVARNIEEVFGAAPQYDRVGGVMSLHLGGCPPDYFSGGVGAAPHTGWTCLRALFTDRRVPGLYRLDYTQVVHGEPDAARRALNDNFGPPASEEVAGNGDTRLVWRLAVADSGGAQVAETLAATLSGVGGAVVVDLVLEVRDDSIDEQGKAPGADNGHADGSVQLKL